MSTYPKGHLLHEISTGEPIPPNTLGYFSARFRNNVYAFVVGKFLERARTDGLTKAQLGRRIGKGPDQISRWLRSPGNWTLETVSDLLLGIAAEEFRPVSESVLDRPGRNFSTFEYVDDGADDAFVQWDNARTRATARAINVQ